MPSTVISNIHYNASTFILRITFVSGMIYEYKNVPEEIYHGLITSGAKEIFKSTH